MFQHFSWTSPKTINALKTAIACVIGYLCIKLTSLPQAQWIVITIIVVMSAQTTIGSLFIKAQMRFWGTLLGALSAVAIIIICRNNPLGIGIALFVASLIFAYLAAAPGDISYVGTLGAVTVAIIILTPAANLVIAGERFLEIILGLLISFLISCFVFPIRSHTLFLSNLESTLIYLHEYFVNSFEDSAAELNKPLHDLNEKILGIFTQQRRLIYETGIEFGKTRQDKKNFQTILDTERRVYRGLNLIYYSLHSTAETRKITQSIDKFAEFKTEVAHYILQLADKVKNGCKLDEFNLCDYDRFMEQDFLEKKARLNHSDDSNVYTFIFSVRFLLTQLQRLHHEISRFVNAGPAKRMCL